ncbi:MAG: glycosyltransferase family 39 protein [Isosphaeraceae bacterium]|nr:glycosyltransferase family 39 protein [Isosphaeraceae bacterium]
MAWSARRSVGLGLAVLVALVAGASADRTWGWITPAFDAVAHLFYEIPVLAALRRPTQLMLVRWHLAILMGLIALGLILAPWIGRHGRLWWAVFGVGYAIRAILWIAGGNLPLVPGDSCHYLEVASSVYHGEGPVKHYVESYFIDYNPHGLREGRGVLDDWATPLWAYVLAGAYRLVGVVPGRALEQTVAVAKGTSFTINLLCLPALYGFARRRFGPGVGLRAMAALAVLPVHALYAGFGLRESLVALTSILAIWALTEVWAAEGLASWGWAIVAGLLGGLAILARNTALALLAAAGLYSLLAHGRRHLGPLLAWGLTLGATIAPWAYATYQEYGEPFYTYTKYFQYNFSWAIHHYEKGNTRPSEFYTWANAPTIVRVKIKSLLIILVYSAMIVSLPIACGFFRRLLRPASDSAPGRDADRLVFVLFLTFVAATLANIADVTQVAQLGRYYLPVYILALPTAVAGLGEALRSWSLAPRAYPWLGATLVALWWSDPTWAYDATWLVKPYQLHWPALRDAGDWVRQHPEVVPEDARVMTWFPWEFRVASQRTTVLLPRSYFEPHIERAIQQYRVTHVLWGSFEPPHIDPQSFGPYLDRLRLRLGLTDDREVYRSPAGLPYPVRLYRLPRGTP